MQTPYSAEFPPDRFVQNQYGHMIEWRRDITDPNTLFDNEERIGRSFDVQPANEIEVNASITSAVNWHETMYGYGSGEHRLRAVINANSQNIGLVDTIIDGRSVTYIARLGDNKDERASLMGIMDTYGSNEVSLSFTDGNKSDRWEGEEKQFMTISKREDGTLSIRNESLEPMRVGMGAELLPMRSFRERFSLRSAYNGLKRAIAGEPAGPRKYAAFIGGTNWMVPDITEEVSMAEAARWMRNNNYAWYVTQPA